MNTAQCELGWAFIALPNIVYNSVKNVFILYEVSHAAKLQAEMTKTKTQAELHRSREPQWAWLVHSPSELRNRLLTPTPWDAHHHSEAKRPPPSPQQTHTFKGAPWAAALCAPSQCGGIMGEKKRLNAQREACLHLSHESTLCISVVYYRNASPQGLTT